MSSTKLTATISARNIGRAAADEAFRNALDEQSGEVFCVVRVGRDDPLGDAGGLRLRFAPADVRFEAGKHAKRTIRSARRRW
jgi:hypothetical protein